MIGVHLRFTTRQTLPTVRGTLQSRSRRSFVLYAKAAHNMPDQVVICGGGIIGSATAYYLTLQGVKPILVEKSGIACAASGINEYPCNKI